MSKKIPERRIHSGRLEKSICLELLAFAAAQELVVFFALALLELELQVVLQVVSCSLLIS
jgi:hypothetical protein